MKTEIKSIGQKVITTKNKLVKSIINAIDDKKGENIVVLDLKQINESIADYFIICDASNPLQVKSIADNIEEKAFEQLREKPMGVDGKKGQQWIVVDFVDVIVHIMMPAVRERYALEELWHDANKLEH